MTRKLKFLRRVERARKQVRDAVAGEVARVDAMRLDKQREKEWAESTRDEMLTAAARRLHRVENARDLMLFEMERRLQEVRVREAEAQHLRAEKEARHLREALTEKEIELRLSQKLMERIREHIRAAGRRQEQKVTDDMVSARLGRGRWG